MTLLRERFGDYAPSDEPWEDSKNNLDKLLNESSDPIRALRRYPETFPWALEKLFADVNVAWLKKVLLPAKVVNSKESEKRARAIFSAVAGAQLMARSRAGIGLFDALIAGYRAAGLLPA